MHVSSSDNTYLLFDNSIALIKPLIFTKQMALLDYFHTFLRIQVSKILFYSPYCHRNRSYSLTFSPLLELMFEITLLGFRPRPVWVKPLLQEPGLSEKPYQTTKGQNMGVGMEVAK